MNPLKLYAGIGSRETPDDVLILMYVVASLMSKDGWILRSGGAVGADTAFEKGASYCQIMAEADATEEAIELASKYHPNWQACSPRAKRLHGRNSMILLGTDLLSPVKMVICWTPGGKVVGGTGQALRMAAAYNIPTRNLAIDSVRQSTEKWVRSKAGF